eukprot:6144770-Lingulodinium_polyedra.AAC.1
MASPPARAPRRRCRSWSPRRAAWAQARSTRAPPRSTLRAAPRPCWDFQRSQPGRRSPSSSGRSPRSPAAPHRRCRG